MTLDSASKGIGVGIGIAAMGIGLGIAFDSMRGIQKQTRKKRVYTYQPPKFKPFKL
jgi:F0F1-type ATP synthase membrane subunit c/vacuolar-type H+-ATPase subunit K